MKKQLKSNVYRPPTLAELQAEVDAFNARVSIGDTVLVKRDGVDTLGEYKTQTAAQILSGHSAVVWLDGVSGCYCLTHVVPAPGPTVHRFDSTGEAYDATQCDENIQRGDILLIESERVVGVADTWPFAVTPTHGHLHALASDASSQAIRDEFLIPIAKAHTIAATL